jgi:hypothetical protein
MAYLITLLEWFNVQRLSLALTIISLGVFWRVMRVLKKQEALLQIQARTLETHENVLRKQLTIFEGASGAIDQTHEAVQTQILQGGLTRDAELTALLLNRYIEDRDLFVIRGLVHKHTVTVRTGFAGMAHAGGSARVAMEESLREKTGGDLGLDHLVRLVMSLEHACVLMQGPFMSKGARKEFVTLICGMWPLVHEFIEWEGKARGRSDYAVNLRKQAAEWCSAVDEVKQRSQD